MQNSKTNSKKCVKRQSSKQRYKIIFAFKNCNAINDIKWKKWKNDILFINTR